MRPTDLSHKMLEYRSIFSCLICVTTKQNQTIAQVFEFAVCKTMDQSAFENQVIEHKQR